MQNNGAPRYDLNTIFPGKDSPQWRNARDQLKQCVEQFYRKYHGRVASLEPDALLGAFQDEGEIFELQARLNVYAYLSFAQDTSSPERQSLLAITEEFQTEIYQQLVFFDLELGHSDNTRWLQSDLLAEYKYHIVKAAERASHNLSEEMEAYQAEKNLTGRQALATIFDEHFGRFTFELNIRGELQTFTEESALAALHSGDREFRSQVYSGFLERVGSDNALLSGIYNTVVLDYILDAKRRGFAEPIDARNLANEVSRSNVLAMLDVVEQGYPLAQRYFKLKSRYLGYEQMTNADIYAPLVATEQKIEFERGRELVERAYGNFHPRAGEIVAGFFTAHRTDIPPAPGKRAGAFCYGASPGIDAYIHMNYTDDIHSVQTLAHELGHGLHHQLAKRNNHTAFDTPLTTAETASVFGEILLNEMLFQESQSQQEKLAILGSQMEGMIATVFRQTVLTRFEQRVFDARKTGRLSGDLLGEIWLEENRKLYGDAVQMVEPYRYGWSYIPHFIHTPFYCYAYSYGQLLVMALYHRFLEQGESFKDGYLSLLAMGGSKRPDQLIREAVGIDIGDPGFWRGALALIESNLTRIEQLIQF